MVVRTSVGGKTVTNSVSITGLSISLSISVSTITSISVSSVAQALWGSVSVASGTITNSISITGLSISGSLPITIDVVTIGVRLWVAISVIGLGDRDRGGTISTITTIAIAWLSISLSITAIAVTAIGKTLGASVCVACSVSRVESDSIAV